jgi:hypothetical protein
MVDFWNENRYRKRRIVNRIMNAIWSVIVTVIVISLIVMAAVLCLPWLESLWDTTTKPL